MGELTSEGLYKPSFGESGYNDEIAATMDLINTAIRGAVHWDELPFIDAAEMYGVVADGAGDGVTGTDNYAAIQELIADVNALDGAHIKWPRGIILINQHIVSGNGISVFRFEGCTKGVVMDCVGTTFDFKGAFHRLVTSTSMVSFHFRNCYNVTINGGEFDGNVDQMTREVAVSEGGGTALNFQGTHGITLNDVWAHHWYADGLGIGFAAFTSGGPPRRACFDAVAINSRFTSNGRQGMSITACKRGTFLGCTFDHSGHTDEDGTAVGGYTGHAPQMGVDIEIGLNFGTDDNDMDADLSDILFYNCRMADNLGKCFGSGHPNNQSRILLDHCYLKAEPGQGDYAVIMASADGSIVNSVIDCGDEASVWIGFTKNDAPLSGASWSGGYITFEFGSTSTTEHTPDWPIGTTVVIAGSNPAGYDGHWKIVDYPTPNSCRVRCGTDPGTYVGSGTYMRLMTGEFRGNYVVGQARVLVAGYDHTSYRVIDNDIIGMHTSPIPLRAPDIGVGVEEFAFNRVFLSAEGHDGVTSDVGSQIAATRAHDNVYRTNLEERGDASLFFSTLYAAADHVYNEFYPDAPYWIPEGQWTGFDGTLPFSWFMGVLRAQATWNPPSIADSAMTSTTVTVAGAALGDLVTASFSNAVPAGALLTAQVTAADTVTVTLFNKTGGVLDLASGTLRVTVREYGI